LDGLFLTSEIELSIFEIVPSSSMVITPFLMGSELIGKI
jgi:hypothetical protein